LTNTYTNPVYGEYFADPFILQYDGRYYAYGTAKTGEKNQFPVLESRDLIHWTRYGGVLIPPGGDAFWAPEVAFHDGQFYLYYSVHGIENRDHQLRVALSEYPYGPFEDCGVVLVPNQPFTIDAHPFQDTDGQWYLFYARDFLTIDGDCRVGTGIVVDRLVNMQKVANSPQVVVRPSQEWQLFAAQRPMYGKVYDWYTVEGPAVRLHNGHYYCFFSGGAWEHDNYGISYVVADHPHGPYRYPQGGSNILLKSVPGKVIGPGHNSFAYSPDGSEELVVYHAWDPQQISRLMRIDRLTWDQDRPVIHGPTWSPQPAFTRTRLPRNNAT
jgi:GH43 family beta-xylosidase